MNITFLLDYNLNENVGGGILNAVKNSALHLSKNHKISIISLANQNREYKLQNINVLEIESTALSGLDSLGKTSGERVVHLNSKNQKIINNFLSQQNPEVVIYNLESYLSVFVTNWVERNNKKLVGWLHVLANQVFEFQQNNGFITKQLLKIGNKLLTKPLQAQTSAIIVINESAKQDLLNLGYKGDIFVMANARDISKYNQINNKETFKSKNITFIGHLSDRKNQKYLIKILKYLKSDVNLNLVGAPFNRKYYLELKKMSEGEQVQFVEEVEHNKISEILRDTKLFVSASKKEVQSLVILEAMSAGLPIVALENETTTDFKYEKFIKVLNKHTDPKVFAKEVESLLNLSEERYLELSKLSKIYSQNFSFEKQEQKLLEIYNSLEKKTKQNLVGRFLRFGMVFTSKVIFRLKH